MPWYVYEQQSPCRYWALPVSLSKGLCETNKTTNNNSRCNMKQAKRTRKHIFRTHPDNNNCIDNEIDSKLASNKIETRIDLYFKQYINGAKYIRQYINDVEGPCNWQVSCSSCLYTAIMSDLTEHQCQSGCDWTILLNVPGLKADKYSLNLMYGLPQTLSYVRTSTCSFLTFIVCSFQMVIIGLFDIRHPRRWWQGRYSEGNIAPLLMNEDGLETLGPRISTTWSGAGPTGCLACLWGHFLSSISRRCQTQCCSGSKLNK